MNGRALTRVAVVVLAAVLILAAGRAIFEQEFPSDALRGQAQTLPGIFLAAFACIVLARKGKGTSPGREQAFWYWLAGGCALSVAARLLPEIQNYNGGAMHALAGALETGFRLAIIAGIGLRPHATATPAANAEFLRVRFLSFLLFGQGVMVYFLVIPASLSPHHGQSLDPVPAAILIMDVAIALSFWFLAGATQPDRWQSMYRLASTGFVCAAVADVFSGLASSRSNPDLMVTLAQILGSLAFVPLIAATRVVFLPPPGMVRQSAENPGWGEIVGIVPAAAYALAIAAIHLTMEAAEWLPPHTEFARSVATMACLLLLAALSLREKILSIQQQMGKQREMQESERFFELVFQNTPGPCFVYDLQGRMKFGNRAMEELTGYSLQELSTLNLVEAGLLPAGGSPQGKAPRKHCEEFLLKRKDGRLIPIELQRFSIRRAGQRFILGVARNIEAQKLADEENQRIQDELERRVAWRTAELQASNCALSGEIAERKRSESALRSSEAKLRAIIDADPQGVQMLDEAGQLLLMNPAGLKMFEAGSFEEVRLLPVEDWVAPEYQETYQQALLAARSGQQTSIEYEYITRKGRRRWMKSCMISLRDPDDSEAAAPLLALSQDITEHRQMQHQLLESQKTGIIGRMAGAVAHEFNNLLTVIKGHAELLEELHQGNAERHSIREILDACRTAASFTRQLLAVGQKQLIAPEITDANTLVPEIVKDLSGLFKKHLTFEVQAEARSASILVDPRQLRQVILLLAHHAQERLPRGSRLQIRTGNVNFAVKQGAPDEICLLIQATYPGYSSGKIPPQNVFDVFAEPGLDGLSHLDLAAVRGTVEQSGGAVRAEFTRSGDLSIQIIFPVRQNEPEYLLAATEEAGEAHSF